MPQEPPASPVVSAKFDLRDLGWGALLLFLTFLFYLPALHGGLIFDDDRHITPPALRSLHGLWRIWAEPGAAFQYYPVLHTVFWLEQRFWGDAVTGCHVVNLLLHAGSALLVVAIMRRLALPGAWLAAFIFALHPVCVESVAWISELKNTLSLFLCMGSALVYLHFDRKRRTPLYLLAAGLFVLAVLSKTVSATLPGALLVIFWWQRGRLDWKRDVLPLLPWFIFGGCAGMFSGWMERKFYNAEGFDYFDLTFLDHCLLACREIWFYLAKLLWPSDLMFYYPLWKIDHTAPWQYVWLLATLVLVGALCIIARRSRGPLAVFLIFAGTLFPVLGFFNIGWFSFSYVADHFQYMASLGIIVPVAAFLAGVTKKIQWETGRRGVAVGAGMLLLVLSSLTWHQSQMYRDMETLYATTVERNPGSYMAHYNYGIVLMKVPGRLSEALGHFEETLRLRPDDPALQSKVGSIMLPIDNRLPEAIADFQAALRLKPDYAEAHCFLGIALLKTTGGLPDAVEHLEAALKLKPDMAEAHYFLGVALSTIPGRTQDAITHLEAALRLNPDIKAAKEKLDQLLQLNPA